MGMAAGGKVQAGSSLYQTPIAIRALRREPPFLPYTLKLLELDVLYTSLGAHTNATRGVR